jgi:hypothetical protein
MKSNWNIIRSNFKSIINDIPLYKTLYKYISIQSLNTLLYGAYGFPTDLLIDEIIKEKFGLVNIYRTECIWNKNIVYNENQYFFEIDLMNPNMPKDYSFLTELILHIIKSKNILVGYKHFIILKHIDLLHVEFFTFRILLERFTENAYFLCTTHKISKIEAPIRSRFYCIRVPLFEHTDIIKIFNKYLKIKLNKYLIENKSRDFIKAIFFAEVEKNEPNLLTYEFCNYNFPLLYDFMNNFSKKTSNLEDIRQFSYKCCQYNISIKDLTIDLLNHKSSPKNIITQLNDTEELIEKSIEDTLDTLNIDINKKSKSKKIKNSTTLSKETKYKIEIIKKAADIDHKLSLTNKGREPLYIECLLCQVLLE